MGFTIIANIDDSDDDQTIMVMGHRKPEANVASTSYNGMQLIRTRNRNKAKYPIPKHFPLEPVKRDKIIIYRSCNEVPPDPPWPTDFIPGTPEKLEVMAWRYRMGFKVHHPLDARLNTTGRMSERELATA